MATNGKRNRGVGKDWERTIVLRLKERKIYPHAISTRQGSRELDAMGIDLMNSNEFVNGVMNDTIQAKSYSCAVSYISLLEKIKASGRLHPVIFHKYTTRTKDPKQIASGGGETFVPRAIFAISYIDTYVEGMAARKAVERILKLEALPDEVIKILNELGFQAPVV